MSKNKIKNIILGLVYTLFLCINYYWMDLRYVNENKNVVFIFFTLITTLLLVMLLTKLKKMKIENKYLVIIMYFSLIFFLIVPYKHMPDEEPHFFRSSEIAQGQFISNTDEKTGLIGRYDSKSFVENNDFTSYIEYYSKINDPLSEEQTFVKYPTSALYPFLIYIPQAIGIMIVNLLGGSTLFMILMSKIINLFTYIFISYYALKIIPKYKKFCLVILLFPSTVMLAMSLAPDGFLISLTMLFIAIIMKVREEKEISTVNKVLLPILVVFISLAKIAYFPIIFALILLPKSAFKSNREKNIYIWSTLLICTILNVLWTKFAMTSFLSDTVVQDTNAKLQAEFVLTHPFLYIKYFFNTLSIFGFFFIDTMIQKDLINVYVRKPEIYYWISFVILWISLFFNKDDFKLKKNAKALMVLVFRSSIALIFTGLYVQWSPYLQPFITGVQGRYFLPLLFLFPLFTFKFKKEFLTVDMIIVVFMMINCLYLIQYTLYFLNYGQVVYS